MTLNIPGEELLTTSTDFLELPERPDRAVFVGGGFIAMEFAHIAKRPGAREVTVLEMMEQPLGNFDPDLADVLCEATGELGIALRPRATVMKIDNNGSGLTVTYAHPTETAFNHSVLFAISSAQVVNHTPIN